MDEMMHNMDTLTAFFGWCAVINIVILGATTILLTLMKDVISGIHSKMTGLSQADLLVAYFGYLANYKIAILVLNLVPYIALKLIDQA